VRQLYVVLWLLQAELTEGRKVKRPPALASAVPAERESSVAQLDINYKLVNGIQL